jgi:hypothetical protein
MLQSYHQMSSKSSVSLQTARNCRKIPQITDKSRVKGERILGNPPKRAPGRPPRALTLQRERDAWRLRQRGWSLARIADALQVSEPSAWKMLNRVAERYHADLASMVATARRQQIAQLEHIADEALQAWEASKQEVRTVTRRKREVDGRTVQEATQEDVQRLPDVRYLQEARAALADIRSLLGADAPMRSHVSIDARVEAQAEVRLPAEDQSQARMNEIVAALAESGALQIAIDSVRQS